MAECEVTVALHNSDTSSDEFSLFCHEFFRLATIHNLRTMVNSALLWSASFLARELPLESNRCHTLPLTLSFPHPLKRRKRGRAIFNNNLENGYQGIENSDDTDEELFLRQELDHIENLEEILKELEDYDLIEDDDADHEDIIWEKESLEELFGSVEQKQKEEENGDVETESKAPLLGSTNAPSGPALELQSIQARIQQAAAKDLENALLTGVVPASAGVGSECLPGDWGFDPLNLASKDYFCLVQNSLTRYLSEDGQPSVRNDQLSGERPKALILRDYREAEIRHGRLAMLAAMFWPLQELLDRYVLGEAQPLIFSAVTLPYFPLVMTAIMLLLGYLDIYSKDIKAANNIGEAFLPGDCKFMSMCDLNELQLQ